MLKAYANGAKLRSKTRATLAHVFCACAAYHAQQSRAFCMRMAYNARQRHVFVRVQHITPDKAMCLCVRSVSRPTGLCVCLACGLSRATTVCFVHACAENNARD